MWLMTTFGFFSIIQEEPLDGLLTVRAPVRQDLETLRERYLPTLTDIENDPEAECKFRARASREAVGQFLSRIAMDIDYASFRDRTKELRGSQAARIHGGLWEVLWKLKKE